MGNQLSPAVTVSAADVSPNYRLVAALGGEGRNLFATLHCLKPVHAAAYAPPPSAGGERVSSALSAAAAASAARLLGAVTVRSCGNAGERPMLRRWLRDRRQARIQRQHEQQCGDALDSSAPSAAAAAAAAAASAVPRCLRDRHQSYTQLLLLPPREADAAPPEAAAVMRDVVVKVFVRAEGDELQRELLHRIHRMSAALAEHMAVVDSTLQHASQPSNVLFASRIQARERDPCCLMERSFVAYSLPERLVARPYWQLEERLFACYQLLNALLQLHEVFGVTHGDLKPSNVLIQSYGWLYVSDLAPFKPNHMPMSNPALFDYYYVTDDSRWCCVAPEKFTHLSLDEIQRSAAGASGVPSSDGTGAALTAHGAPSSPAPTATTATATATATTAASAAGTDAPTSFKAAAAATAANFNLYEHTTSMDIFSAACVMAYILTDEPLFSLADVLELRGLTTREAREKKVRPMLLARGTPAFIVPMLLAMLCPARPEERPTARELLEGRYDAAREHPAGDAGGSASLSLMHVFPAFYSPLLRRVLPVVLALPADEQAHMLDGQLNSILATCGAAPSSEAAAGAVEGVSVAVAQLLCPVLLHAICAAAEDAATLHGVACLERLLRHCMETTRGNSHGVADSPPQMGRVLGGAAALHYLCFELCLPQLLHMVNSPVEVAPLTRLVALRVVSLISSWGTSELCRLRDQKLADARARLAEPTGTLHRATPRNPSDSDRAGGSADEQQSAHSTAAGAADDDDDDGDADECAPATTSPRRGRSVAAAGGAAAGDEVEVDEEEEVMRNATFLEDLVLPCAAELLRSQAVRGDDISIMCELAEQLPHLLLAARCCLEARQSLQEGHGAASAPETCDAQRSALRRTGWELFQAVRRCSAAAGAPLLMAVLVRQSTLLATFLGESGTQDELIPLLTTATTGPLVVQRAVFGQAILLHTVLQRPQLKTLRFFVDEGLRQDDLLSLKATLDGVAAVVRARSFSTWESMQLVHQVLPLLMSSSRWVSTAACRVVEAAARTHRTGEVAAYLECAVQPLLTVRGVPLAQLSRFRRAIRRDIAGAAQVGVHCGPTGGRVAEPLRWDAASCTVPGAASDAGGARIEGRRANVLTLPANATVRELDPRMQQALHTAFMQTPLSVSSCVPAALALEDTAAGRISTTTAAAAAAVAVTADDRDGDSGDVSSTEWTARAMARSVLLARERAAALLGAAAPCDGAHQEESSRVRPHGEWLSSTANTPASTAAAAAAAATVLASPRPRPLQPISVPADAHAAHLGAVVATVPLRHGRLLSVGSRGDVLLWHVTEAPSRASAAAQLRLVERAPVALPPVESYTCACGSGSWGDVAQGGDAASAVMALGATDGTLRLLDVERNALLGAVACATQPPTGITAMTLQQSHVVLATCSAGSLLAVDVRADARRPVWRCSMDPALGAPSCLVSLREPGAGAGCAAVAGTRGGYACLFDLRFPLCVRAYDVYTGAFATSAANLLDGCAADSQENLFDGIPGEASRAVLCACADEATDDILQREAAAADRRRAANVAGAPSVAAAGQGPSVLLGTASGVVRRLFVASADVSTAFAPACPPSAVSGVGALPEEDGYGYASSYAVRALLPQPAHASVFTAGDDRFIRHWCQSSPAASHTLCCPPVTRSAAYARGESVTELLARAPRWQTSSSAVRGWLSPICESASATVATPAEHHRDAILTLCAVKSSLTGTPFLLSGARDGTLTLWQNSSTASRR